MAKIRSLVEGVDFYRENGRYVFTSLYHLKRGHCCNSGCRHCPYREAASSPLARIRLLGLPAPPAEPEPGDPA